MAKEEYTRLVDEIKLGISKNPGKWLYLFFGDHYTVRTRRDVYDKLGKKQIIQLAEEAYKRYKPIDVNRDTIEFIQINTGFNIEYNLFLWVMKLPPADKPIKMIVLESESDFFRDTKIKSEPKVKTISDSPHRHGERNET